MTTIPIEVIVQDTESPVEPTPTPADPTDSVNQGENTNITVPDTGAGTVDSNNSSNSFNGSSAVISIVSIVIAVLAICAAVALLARRHYKRKKANIETGMTRQEKRAMAATSTIAVLALTILLGQLVVAGVVSPIATNAASDDTVSDETNHIDVADKISIVVERTEDNEETVAKVTNASYVTSTADFGYKVTVAMAENATTANLYLDGDETSDYYIAPVSNEEDGTLEANTWGYILAEEDEDYLPMPLVDNVVIVLQGEGKVEDEEMTIYYGVNVDKELPAGTYEGTIEYTLVPTPGFPDTLVYMQDMTPEICANAPTPGNKTTDPVPTATLIDKRDNKTYTIAKLADGNCWMTQNLDLDLNSQVALTPENTNISESWTPVNGTISFTGTTVSGWSNSNTVPYSADPGEIYYYTSDTNENDIQYNSLAECEAAGHTDCSHYHAGNYYNWSAAVASNDTSDMTEPYSNAPDSICPAGWRLPTGRQSDDALLTGNELGTMVNDYGVLGESHDCGDRCVYYDYVEGGLNIIRANPLWLVRPGEIAVRGGAALYSAGSSGYYFSKTVLSNSDAVGLGFSSVVPTSLSRSYGESIRCLSE